MFTLPLDTLFVFAASTPIIGWILRKGGAEKLCGVYAIIGLLTSGSMVYNLFLEASKRPVTTSVCDEVYASCLRVDTLSVFMASTFIGIGLLAAVYSIKYMEGEKGIPLYYTLLLSMVGGMVGVAFAGDFFTLFVFWELMCVSSYVLVAFRKRRWESVEAGLKYLLMSAAGSASLLFGLSLIYGLAGTLNFHSLASIFKGVKPNIWLGMASLFLFAGFGVKAAVVPLHTWLPDAYSAAPAPISAILSAVVTETGVYALCRVFFTVFQPLQVQWSMVLAVLSLVTMTFGNITALLQNDLKRLLAYSSIGHIGYMLVGLAVGTQIGLTGTALHIFNHALMKGACFLCVGAFVYRVGVRRLDEIAGIGRRMPFTTIALCVSLFALTGMPPLNGFISELTLFMSSVEAGMTWLGVAIIVNSLFSSGYVLRVVKALLQRREAEGFENVKEAPLLMLTPILVMVFMIVLFGVWPDPVLEFARKAAYALLSMGS